MDRETTAFSRWLRLWSLTPDGPPLKTRAARLVPVRWQGRPAMLKVATSDEERRGAEVLRAFGPEIAAEVLALDGPAVLMARGGGDLVNLALTDDAQATAVICEVASGLHAAPRMPGLTTLATWFAALTGDAGRTRFPVEATLAERLLAGSPSPVPLHGDLHHGNVLRFDEGWRVIDPKGLRGDRCFDYVQLFYNPDAIDPGHGLATRPDVFRARLDRVARTARLDPDRLCDWIRAHAALSLCWAGPQDDPTLPLAIGALAQTR